MGRLDHFVHLGVDIIALSPVFQGNMEKYGLAVTDFKNIHPDFGTLEDFKALTEAAKAKSKLTHYRDDYCILKYFFYYRLESYNGFGAQSFKQGSPLVYQIYEE